MFFSTSVQPTSQSEQRLAGHKPLEPARVLLKAFRIDNMESLHQAGNSRPVIQSGAPRQFFCPGCSRARSRRTPKIGKA